MPLIILSAKTMVSINKIEYFYVQSENSIMRNDNSEKAKKKLQDKLTHFDSLTKKVEEMKLQKVTEENAKIFATNSVLAIIPELDETNKKWITQQLKERKIANYIKARNIKQLVKKIILALKY